MWSPVVASTLETFFKVATTDVPNSIVLQKCRVPLRFCNCYNCGFKMFCMCWFDVLGNPRVVGRKKLLFFFRSAEREKVITSTITVLASAWNVTSDVRYTLSSFLSLSHFVLPTAVYHDPVLNQIFYVSHLFGYPSKGASIVYFPFYVFKAYCDTK